MIVDLTDAHWRITPAAVGSSVEVVIEAEGRRFVAMIDESAMPFLERLVETLPRTGPVDLGAESARALGANPFAEEPLDRRPWYRRLIGRRPAFGLSPHRPSGDGTS
ncbi:hypothetical protein ACFQS1_15015 [Paractinoplanes rhizophilus]|jgi:hypothetical protein|uniref:Uncharacterized protein n=1 Tax=Paractinoplanes rhizophilus TaxID=1416877 RepID=A0ABW2HRR6_9ACTN|nr:hypothetical protein [Actinoplanes sp.]